MRVYQFRHVGTDAAYYFVLQSALPPKSAIIQVFGVLRQINFSVPWCHASCPYFTLLSRFSLGPPRKTEIIAEQIEMSKRATQNYSRMPG